MTERQHLEAAQRQMRRAIPELHPDPLPPALAALWGSFLELNGTRVASGSGAGPITFGEIAEWQRMRGASLTPWEVETIRAVDSAVLAVVSEQKARA